MSSTGSGADEAGRGAASRRRRTAELFDGLAGFDVGAITYEAAIRASLGQAIPLLTLWSLDRIDLGIYASFAAFTAIYGRSEPYRHRWLSTLVAALCLVASVFAGLAVRLAQLSDWAVAAGLAVIIAVTLPLSFVMQWIPRGALFFVFAYLAIANYPVPADGPALPIAVTLASAALSWCIVMSGWVLRRIGPVGARMRELPHVPERRIRSATDPAVLRVTVFAILGALSAGFIASCLDVASHHYWAMVTVAAIFANPVALVSFERLVHRVVGTLAGVGFAAALFGGNPPSLFVIIVCVLCSFTVEAVIGSHYGVGLGFITPLAIGAANLGLTTDWETLFVDRSRETFIGAAVTFVIILFHRWRLQRHGVLRPSRSTD